MACKNVIYVISSNAREANLIWFLEADFVNYISICQLHGFPKAQL